MEKTRLKLDGMLSNFVKHEMLAKYW